MSKKPEVDYSEELWQRVENIAFAAIRDISVELAELPEADKEEIYKRFDAIAVECMRRNEVEDGASIH